MRSWVWVIKFALQKLGRNFFESFRTLCVPGSSGRFCVGHFDVLNVGHPIRWATNWDAHSLLGVHRWGLCGESEGTGLAVPAAGETPVRIGSCDIMCALNLWVSCVVTLLGSRGDADRPVTADLMAPKLKHACPAIVFRKTSV